VIPKERKGGGSVSAGNQAAQVAGKDAGSGGGRAGRRQGRPGQAPQRCRGYLRELHGDSGEQHTLVHKWLLEGTSCILVQCGMSMKSEGRSKCDEM
jgi:hypothetical protein